jgi:hypothetical protein
MVCAVMIFSRGKARREGERYFRERSLRSNYAKITL